MVRRWRNNENGLRATLEFQKKIHTPNRSRKETVIKSKRFRVSGAGRKVTDGNLEEALFQWVIDRRNDCKVVTRKKIQRKALELAESLEMVKPFNASNGWCANFLKRYGLTTRTKTHQSQRLPNKVVPKVVDFFRYVRYYYAKNNVMPGQTVAMDETNVKLENVSDKTVSTIGELNNN